MALVEIHDHEHCDRDCREAEQIDCTGDAPVVWHATTLLGSRREAIIECGGQRYRLRITSNNKLILTK